MRDDEGAHSKEDALFRDVLSHIADEWPDHPAGNLAGEALKSRTIKFERWCA